MIKKIMGVLLALHGVLMLLNLSSYVALVLIVPYVLSGIFLITFDGILKNDYINAFRKRKIQNKISVVLGVIYFSLAAYVLWKVFAMILYSALEGDLLGSLFIFVVAVEYIIPAITFIFMVGVYDKPFSECEKHIYNNKRKMEETFSELTDLTDYSGNGTVLANEKVIFFPKHLSVIPKEKIASVKKVRFFMRGVRFYLTNAGKVTVITKEYESIMAAMKDKKQEQ